MAKNDKNFAPGSHGCHEALHMTSFLINAVDEELCDHPSIKANPKWAKLADDAQQRLYRLYQAIGKEHMTTGDH
jgi:hypothetical protein